jgi:fibronectin-binding autotransporter adhesin
MGQVTWTNFSDGDWTDGSNWDTGSPPGSGDDAVFNIDTFNTVSVTNSITVNSISFDNPSGALQIANSGGTDTVTAFYENQGLLGLDTSGAGGSTLDIVGTLTNSGNVQIGNAGMTTAGTLMAGVFDNTGDVSIAGGATGVAIALMTVAGAAPATLIGRYTIASASGGAVLQWGSGGITQLGGGNFTDFGILTLDGAGTNVEIGTNGSNSAVSNLATIASNGELELLDGVTMAIAAGLTVDGGGFDGGALSVDETGSGGSDLVIGGDLVNASTAAVFNIGAATVSVGNAGMTSAGTLKVLGTFDDANSNLFILGGAVAGAMALMDVSGAAPVTLTGSYDIVANTGGASLQWGRGGIIQIGDGASTAGDLVIDGTNASAGIGGFNDDALDSLGTIAGNGTLELDDGAAINIGASLTVANGGSLVIDSEGESGPGGSTITVENLLLSTLFSTLDLGNAHMTAADSLTVSGTLDNAGGIVDLQGGTLAGAAARMTVNGAAPGTLTSIYIVDADAGGASLSWASGGITQIGDGTIDSTLSISGADAYAEVGDTNSNSALDNLSIIANLGVLSLSNGAALTISNDLTVDDGGAFLIDTGGGGGSDVIIGGNVTVQSGDLPLGVEVGNNEMTVADTLTVDGTIDATDGFVDLNGGSVAGATANLIVTGAAPGTITGWYDVGETGTIVNGLPGGATLEWGSGGITQIGDGSNFGQVSVIGPNGHLEIGATNNNSALDSLSTIAAFGNLVIAFGASVTTSAGLTIDAGGALFLDGGDSGGGGGSTLTVDGDLVNRSRALEIGNTSVTLASTLTVEGNLVNTGTLFLTGGTAVGATADLLVHAGAPTTLTGIYDIGPTPTLSAGYIIINPNDGGATLRWDSGEITQIGDSAAAGGLLIAGGNDFVEVGTTASDSALTHLATIAASSYLDLYLGVTLATTVSLTIEDGGAFQIDNGVHGGGDNITIGGDLTNLSGADGLAPGILVGNTLIPTADTLTVDGVLRNQATGLVTITGANGAVVQAQIDVTGGAVNAGDVVINADGLLDVTGSGYTQNGGFTSITGTLSASNATLTAGDLVLGGGALIATTLGIGNGAVASGFGILETALTNAGSVEATAGLTVTGAVSGTGDFSVGAGASLTFDNLVTNGQVVTFNGLAATVKLFDAVDFAGTIAGLSPGETIDLASLSFVSGATATISGGTLSVTSNGITDTLSVSGVPDGTQFATVQDTGTGTDVSISCFLSGTLISTNRGNVAVEALAKGDLVLTASGEEQPIVWLGHRRIDCRRHPRPEQVWPVRVRTGAFGAGRPGRDLFLSPDHAIFVDDVFVPVKLLIDGAGIAQVKRDHVTYYHVELPEHAVILSEGLPVESYLDTGDRANFDDGETIRLFPDFAVRLASETASLWETRGAAPLVMAGAALEAARRGLNRPEQPARRLAP